MTGKLRLVLFDCDGTLIDSQHTIVATMQDAWRAEGLTPPSAEAIRRTIGLSLDVAVAQLAGAAAESIVPALVEHYRVRVMALRQSPTHIEPLYDGILDALRALDRTGVLLGVATGKNMRGLIHALETHGIRDLFVTLQTADIAPSKPHPGMVLQALAETGVEAADTLVVGDTTFDVQMARAAGARAIGVTWGYHAPQALLDAGASVLVEHASGIAPTVQQMFARTGELIG